IMNSIRRFGVCALLVATVASLSACDSMSRRQRDTAIGAGVGGVAGAAIGGNALSTLGDAQPAGRFNGVSAMRKRRFRMCAATGAAALPGNDRLPFFIPCHRDSA
ncbi:hypothetical protein M3618_22415, partial [Bacillus licheniformis]